MDSELIQAARGKIRADLIIRNVNVLHVFSGEISRGDVAVKNGKIAGIGEYRNADEIIDGGGRWLVPGFVNAHCHIESSMIEPWQYCAEEARQGVTTMIADPHEIANVAGAEGIRYMLEATNAAPADCYIQLPSCVPATPFEHAGAELGCDELRALRGDKRVLGLGEMMDYPGVLNGSEPVLQKLREFSGAVIDGHAPELTGKDLNGYAAAGISTDHESVTWPEAREKLRAGIAVLAREGSASRNLEAIISGLIEDKAETWFMAFCTDDKHLADIRREGTIRYCIERAIGLGLDPVRAYCMATVNAARIYRLHDIGAIAPGYRADMVLLDDLERVKIHTVFKNGKAVPGLEVNPAPKKQYPNSVRLPPIDENSFELSETGGEAYPVIRIVDGQILTKKEAVSRGEIPAKLRGAALNKISVIERHHASGSMATGLLRGYGLRRGAVAATVGHDSHNLIIVGASDRDMAAAANEAGRMGGGFVYVLDGAVRAAVPLPVYGLMSDAAPNTLIAAQEALGAALWNAGVNPAIDPMITLSFMALPVIPEIRITDMGIFDVANFCFL